MNSLLNKIIATGGWPANDKCPDHPRGKKHAFIDIHSLPSKTEHGRKIGEQLITSQCKYCGCLIVDCPTINV